jgi:hypothetical protein
VGGSSGLPFWLKPTRHLGNAIVGALGDLAFSLASGLSIDGLCGQKEKWCLAGPMQGVALQYIASLILHSDLVRL